METREMGEMGEISGLFFLINYSKSKIKSIDESPQNAFRSLRCKFKGENETALPTPHREKPEKGEIFFSGAALDRVS